MTTDTKSTKETYELRLSVDGGLGLYPRDPTDRIVGASFQAGDVDGRGDTVVLRIERGEQLAAQ